MKLPRALPILAGAAILLSACADDVTRPLTPDHAAAALAADPGAALATPLMAAPDRHLVMFTGTRIRPDFAGSVEALGGTVVFTDAGAGIGAVAGLSDEAAAELARLPGIAGVAPDENMSRPAVFEAPEMELEMATDGPIAHASPAAATYYARQWHMGVVDAHVAWAAGRTGSSDVTVAIIDTGVDATHPDLAGRVDASRSRSFVGPTEAFWYNYWGAPEWADLAGHGTHVAATVSSNAVRAAGVTANVRIMALKTLGLTAAPWSGITQAIVYATDNGADVINMSLGATFPRAGNGWFIAQYLTRAIAYAHSKGVTVVVSAGNDELDLDHDGNLYKVFCSTPLVICVSATGPSEGHLSGPQAFIGGFSDFDEPSFYTNYGRSAISVAAPGGNYVLNEAGTAAVSGGFVWAACSSTRFIVIGGLVYLYPCSSTRLSGYSGTSMASPHVAGLAALLVEDFGRNPAQIRAAIEQSAVDLGQPGTDPFYGKGRINVARALGL